MSSIPLVPCVIQTWLRYPCDLRAGLRDLFVAGGDTDTVGAIFGGIVEARVGRTGMPTEWLQDIVDWPRSVSWMVGVRVNCRAWCEPGQATSNAVG